MSLTAVAKSGEGSGPIVNLKRLPIEIMSNTSGPDKATETLGPDRRKPVCHCP